MPGRRSVGTHNFEPCGIYKLMPSPRRRSRCSSATRLCTRRLSGADEPRANIPGDHHQRRWFGRRRRRIALGPGGHARI
jgi:hypothetical protein